MATRTMKPHPTIPQAYTAECPECGAPNSVRAQAEQAPVKVGVCQHFKRAWRVTADGRIRAEFTR